MANPANKLPPEYDDMHPKDYDPAFTADISTRMRIPDRIAMVEGNQLGDHIGHEDLQRNARMSIPDKIVVTGQDERFGNRALPDLHLDLLRQSNTSNFVGLQTPPRVITLDERPFPVVGEKRDVIQEDEEDELIEQFEKSDMEKNRNGFIPITPEMQGVDSLRREAMMATPSGPLLIDDDDDDDFLRLRKQVLKLSRHVVRLEEENSRRSQREIVLYPVVISYVLFQLAKWFLSGRH